MPKAKPMLLNPAKRRKAEIEERHAAELALAPITALPEAPAQLAGHAYAQALYTALMSLYAETIAEIVTAFDLDTLTDYCLTMEEAYELREMRAAMTKRLVAAQKRGAKGAGDVEYLSDKVLKLDARMDGKRAQAHKLRAALYLTPAARAGRVPPSKPAQPEADEMAELLQEAERVIRD